MMNTALQTIATKALPALSGEHVTYNAAKNVFLSQGYISAAGNMYYKAIRLSNRLVVYYDLGQGYAYTFLNGIKLYCFDGQMDREDWKRLDKYLSVLTDAPLYIDDTEGLSVMELRSKARRLKKEHDIQLIMVDYLQLMTASGMRYNSR